MRKDCLRWVCAWLAVAAVLAAAGGCAQKGTATQGQALPGAATASAAVTDANGNAVTDAQGQAVTEVVAGDGGQGGTGLGQGGSGDGGSGSSVGATDGADDIPPEEKYLNPVVLFLPNESADGFTVRGELTDGTAQHIVSLLVEDGGLPQGCGILSLQINGKSAVADMNSAFAAAIKETGTAGEYVRLGSLVNTLLTYYRLDSITVIAEGEVIETGHEVYNYALAFFPNLYNQTATAGSDVAEGEPEADVTGSVAP
ncbi:MAG: GerMN domain-containing protein [Lachnospiraceae bacterium]|jgi:hypothetical protein|nr:GerMN domain-containing protein [Lachnospiraceae bacterium]